MTPKQAKQLSLYVLGRGKLNLMINQELLQIASEPYVFYPLTVDNLNKIALSVSEMLNSFAPEGTQVAEEPDYLIATITEEEDGGWVKFQTKMNAPAWVAEVLKDFQE